MTILNLGYLCNGELLEGRLELISVNKVGYCLGIPSMVGALELVNRHLKVDQYHVGL